MSSCLLRAACQQNLLPHELHDNSTGSVEAAMEQQALILRNLLVQLERQDAVDNQEPNGIAGEFARLKSQSNKYRTEKTYPSKTAEKPENNKKNRYKDIVPFDHTRVKLTLTTAKNDSDYVNASFITGVSGSRAYIATQGPLPHTVLDFLRMLWEYNIKVVTMACREFEMGKKKCERYWPENQEQPFSCEPFTVHCDSEENKGDYLTRTLRVTYGDCTRTLKQLHYFNWPDHGVPDSIPPILDMLDEMRSYQPHDNVPLCIHCSAGCGRTGVLCVIDYTWNLLKKRMISPDFNIYDLVQNMRTQRPSVVQTKEQYELVYRTIKVLFERYMQSVDTETCSNEVPTVPSAITPNIEAKLCDLSEVLDLRPQFQHLLEEEREVLYHTPLPSASENHIGSRSKDLLRDQEQWHLLRTLPGALTAAQAPQEGPKTRAGKQRMEESEDAPPASPPHLPAVAAAICLMVEDPYFDTPMSFPSSEEAAIDLHEDALRWTVSSIASTPSLCLNEQTLELNSPASGTVESDINGEVPPPLPQRTPESYVMAVDAEHSDPFDKLTVVIPPNYAAEAVRELGSNPPSPVPPLPERTPESFELPVDQAPVKPRSDVSPAAMLNRIGRSSEWSGDSMPAATSPQSETKPWVRSKSLKPKMTFTVAARHHDLALSTTATDIHPSSPPPDPPIPLRLPPTEESLTPPLPDRTPESFILTTEELQEKTAPSLPPLDATRPFPRVGLSSEWDGTAQPDKFHHVVMSRSKSVRPNSFRHEPLTAFRQPAPPPVVVAGAGSAQEGQHDLNHIASVNTDTSGNNCDKSSEKGMSRTRSLKFFRNKPKPKADPPLPPNQPGSQPPSHGLSSTLFKFGFGNRFGKPKGPRSYPETWD
ncbi:tyrosine-protein phosphatase non-receptor type 22 isoform X2 [Pungitius pungitius]|uniref:tyrosine-protein phosphatase non-receptor type 22 isoform X2 n=1 Tax=Pungitius pungitius TaxID=134920 RepID=UPI002E11F8C2